MFLNFCLTSASASYRHVSYLTKRVVLIQYTAIDFCARGRSAVRPAVSFSDSLSPPWTKTVAYTKRNLIFETFRETKGVREGSGT